MRAKNLAPLAERFWKRVDKRGPNECWPWLGATLHDGRGRMHFENGRQETAPRMAWFIENGEWPSGGLHVCHHCDNPSCVNVDHLWLGTQRDNQKDATRKGKRIGQIHCKARFSIADIKAIRSLRLDQGKKLSEIGALYRVSPAYVSKICRGIVWNYALTVQDVECAQAIRALDKHD